MNSTLISYIAGALILAASVIIPTFLVRRFLKLRGPRVVTCPTDNTYAAVEVDSLRATLAVNSPALHLSSCTHWPERANCGQDCLRQIESSPDGCLVREILTRWYAGKACLLCGKEFGQIDWMEHKPCLLQSDGVTVDWNQIHPEDLLGILKTHSPVCWNCHVASAFRHKYPDLVTDRPWKR